MNLVQTATNSVITHYVSGMSRNLICGAALAYSVQNEKYTYIPLVILFPSIFAGYHMYNNREKVIPYMRHLRTELKK